MELKSEIPNTVKAYSRALDIVLNRFTTVEQKRHARARLAVLLQRRRHEVGEHRLLRDVLVAGHITKEDYATSRETAGSTDRDPHDRRAGDIDRAGSDHKTAPTVGRRN